MAKTTNVVFDKQNFLCVCQTMLVLLAGALGKVHSGSIYIYCGMENFATGGLTQFWELFTVILAPPDISDITNIVT